MRAAARWSRAACARVPRVFPAACGTRAQGGGAAAAGTIAPQGAGRCAARWAGRQDGAVKCAVSHLLALKRAGVWLIGPLFVLTKQHEPNACARRPLRLGPTGRGHRRQRAGGRHHTPRPWPSSAARRPAAAAAVDLLRARSAGGEIAPQLLARPTSRHPHRARSTPSERLSAADPAPPPAPGPAEQAAGQRCRKQSNPLGAHRPGQPTPRAKQPGAPRPGWLRTSRPLSTARPAGATSWWRPRSAQPAARRPACACLPREGSRPLRRSVAGERGGRRPTFLHLSSVSCLRTHFAFV